jgi:hypothetical protein
MTKQRKSSSGDTRILLPEGKPARRPPGRFRWIVAVAVLVIVVLVVLWRVFVKRP